MCAFIKKTFSPLNQQDQIAIFTIQSNSDIKKVPSYITYFQFFKYIQFHSEMCQNEKHLFLK